LRNSRLLDDPHRQTADFGDAGYRERKETYGNKGCGTDGDNVSGKRAALDKNDALDGIVDKIEYLVANVRAKVEHPFRAVKQQFRFVKVRYGGLKKNTSRLSMPFAFSNFRMARRTPVKVRDRRREIGDLTIASSDSGPIALGS
jgi:IS5 family transposase